MSEDDDDLMIEGEEDEMIIGDDDEDNIFVATNSDDIPKTIKFDSFLQPQILQLNEMVPNVIISFHDTTLEFQIPSSFLPSSLQMVCGFYLSPILIDVNLIFKTDNWRLPLLQFSATHPIFNQNYVGRPLVLDAIRHFFTSSYKNKLHYKSTEYVIPRFKLSEFEYGDNQLLYLILEIVECFLDIQDHCCICRSPLDYSVIKPTICSSKLCEVGFNEIGVGSSVAQEIRRDPYSADLLVSLFACSNQKYLNPAPPDDIMRTAKNILSRLPAMNTISKNCQNDTDIIKLYGNDTLNLLRWLILSNKSQLIKLPPELKLKNVDFNNQFMTLMAAPRAEDEFQIKKRKNGNKSLFMWHGSGGDRWHSIIRNGLMNMSNRDCIHGASYGPGIYLASDVSTSLGYTAPVHNLYGNSMLGKNLTCIALCEVVPVKKFKDFGGIATLQDEGALIVRFIFPISGDSGNYGYGYGYGSNSSTLSSGSYIPTLADVLRFMGKGGTGSNFNDGKGRNEIDYDYNSKNQSDEKQGKNKKRKNRKGRK